MLTLRPARVADLPQITAIYALAVLNSAASYEYEPPTLEEITARFTAITGANFPSHFRTRPAYRFMAEDSIYIAPGEQGKGLGTLLLGELLARCEASGFRQMIAVIGDAANNLPSARLHSIMGFTECGRIRNSGFKFNRWCDTLLMQRALGEAET